MAILQLHMDDNLYLRDPQGTDLGRRIVEESIYMIDELGIETFTFKKLAEKIDSTEPSIYRYFENKHRLLVYLISWYWNWLEYRIDFNTHNISDAVKRLEIAIDVLTDEKIRDSSFPTIDEAALHRIVIAESDKTYLTKQVDDDNKEGLFLGFKSLCKKISQYIKEINPEYPYPHALVSMMMQSSHQQLFFAEHLPSLTELSAAKDNVYEMNNNFLRNVVFNAIAIPS